jgi:hypothetical protein
LRDYLGVISIEESKMWENLSDDKDLDFALYPMGLNENGFEVHALLCKKMMQQVWNS